jgi:hypothetical protein
MAETSDVFLVRGSLQLLDGATDGMNKTRTLVFISGPAAATHTWTCDVDYNYIGTHSGSGIQATVSTSGQANPSLTTAKISFVNSDILFAGTTTTMSNVPIQKAFLKKGTVITIAQGATGACTTVVLEYINP